MKQQDRTSDWAAWLRLLLTPGVGRASARKLLAAFGPPDVIFAQSHTALCQVVSSSQATSLRTEPEGFAAQRLATQRWLDGAVAELDGAYANSSIGQRALIDLAHPDYPVSLLQIEDPPILLFAQGNMGLLRQQAPYFAQAIAMVGSRNPSAQGAQNAKAFASSFARSELIVVSGLALGIDGAAHAGALDVGGATIAVVGTGLDRVYPKAHRDLAHQIATQGLLLSEYPLGTPPLADNFPPRNRIISGLSLGTLVVEAALQSGSLITARMASEQGKEVFAIPGSIHNVQSRGCHALIKQGAKLVESAQDVLDELRILTAPRVRGGGAAHYEDVTPPPLSPAQPSANAQSATPAQPYPSSLKVDKAEQAFGHLPKPQQHVIQALGHDPVSLEALADRTGYDTPTLQVALLELELANHISRLPGGLFQRLIKG